MNLRILYANDLNRQVMNSMAKKILTAEQIDWAYHKWCEGYRKSEISDALFVSEMTLQRALKGRKRMRPKLVYKYEGVRKVARPINIRLAEAQLKLEAAEISLKKVQAKYDLAKSRYKYLVFSTITIEKIRALKKEKKWTLEN